MRLVALWACVAMSADVCCAEEPLGRVAHSDARDGPRQPPQEMMDRVRWPEALGDSVTASGGKGRLRRTMNRARVPWKKGRKQARLARKKARKKAAKKAPGSPKKAAAKSKAAPKKAAAKKKASLTKKPPAAKKDAKKKAAPKKAATNKRTRRGGRKRKTGRRGGKTGRRGGRKPTTGRRGGSRLVKAAKKLSSTAKRMAKKTRKAAAKALKVTQGTVVRKAKEQTEKANKTAKRAKAKALKVTQLRKAKEPTEKAKKTAKKALLPPNKAVQQSCSDTKDAGACVRCTQTQGTVTKGRLDYCAPECPDGIGPKIPLFSCEKPSDCKKSCFSWKDNMAVSGLLSCVNGPNKALGLIEREFVCQQSVLSHVHTTPESWGLLTTKRVRCYAGRCVVFKVGLCIDVKESVLKKDNYHYAVTVAEANKFAEKALPLLETWRKQANSTVFASACKGKDAATKQSLMLVKRQIAMA